MSVRLLALALALLVSAHAAAQDDPLAAGRAAQTAGDHAAALARFTDAWTSAPTAIARGEMAIEALALHEWLLAETYANEALGLPVDEAFAARRTAVEAARDAAVQHLGSLEAQCTPGCDVRVDGASVGTAPIAHLVRLAEGEHRVEGVLPDAEPAASTVVIVAGEVARVRLAPVPLDHRPILERTGSEGDGQRIGGVIGLAVGGALLVVGGVALGVELAADATLRSSACAPTAPMESREQHCPGAAAERATYTDLARGTLLGGAVLAVAGLVFFLTAPSEPEPTASAVRCAPTLAPGFACEGRF